MSPIDTDRFRQALLEERHRVAEALEHLHTHEQQPLTDEAGEQTAVDNHPADVATVTFDREMGETLEESTEAMLAAIDAALKRIEDGTYGTCKRCGRPIGEDRLEAVPWAELCIECKRLMERG
jgi:DnaK suppressor protein